MEEEIGITEEQSKKLLIILICLIIGIIIGYSIKTLIADNQYDNNCMIDSIEKIMNNTGDIAGGYWDDNITMGRLRFGYEVQNERAKQVLIAALKSTLRKCQN